MSRFVRPETTILKISNGDTLTVKRRLTSGEVREMHKRMYISGVDGTLRANPLQAVLAMVVTYLVDWSLTDDEGRLVAIRDQPTETVIAALDALDSESFVEIKTAIDAHEAEMAAERDQEKKQSAGVNELSAISPSLVGVAGGTSGLPS